MTASRRGARMLFNEKVLCGLGRGLGSKDRTAQSRGRRAGARQSAALRRAGARHRRRAPRRARDRRGARRRGRRSISSPRSSAASPFACASWRAPRRGGCRLWACSPGIPDAAGIVGDLGGGSVELVPIAQGPGRARRRPCRSGRCGSPRSATTKRSSRTRSTAISRRCRWLAPTPDGSFYAVGGAWRALARIHMEQTQYPLHIIQQYTLSARRGREIPRSGRAPVAQIARKDRHRLAQAPRGGAARRAHPRAAPAPHRAEAAGVLRGGIARGAPLQPHGCGRAARRSAARAPAPRRPRPIRASARIGEAIRCLDEPALSQGAAGSAALRRAAALLSDIAWHEHPGLPRRAGAAPRALHAGRAASTTPGAPSSRWRCMRATAAAARSTSPRRSSCSTRTRWRRRGSSAWRCGWAIRCRAACRA